jgi:hypothetical protein
MKGRCLSAVVASTANAAEPQIVAANESSEQQPLPPLAALPAGTLNDKLVRRHDPVEHAPLKPQQLGPEQEEGPSTSPVADALISDLGDAQTLEDLLEVLQARIALGEEVSEEGMLVSVHKLCDFLGVRVRCTANRQKLLSYFQTSV